MYTVAADVDLDGPVSSAAWHTDPLPFWAFCWGSGAALARTILDHPPLVRSLRVVDFGAGSGIAGIAAARAGAASVIAVDLDPQARAACRANAAANGVTLQTASALPDEWDVLLAADVLYAGADNLEHIAGWAAGSRTVLLAVPERPAVPAVPWQHSSRMQITTFPDVDPPTRHIRIYHLGKHRL